MSQTLVIGLDGLHEAMTVMLLHLHLAISGAPYITAYPTYILPTAKSHPVTRAKLSLAWNAEAVRVIGCAPLLTVMLPCQKIVRTATNTSLFAAACSIELFCSC